MTLAAIDALHHSFVGSEKWPMACAGFSGGAKGAGSIAPALARSGCRITGLYLIGVNEDYLSPGYARAQSGADFLVTPVYVSAGRDDRIATVEQQYNVAGSIKRTGFSRIRIGTFHGGREVNDAQTSIALPGSANCKSKSSEKSWPMIRLSVISYPLSGRKLALASQRLAVESGR
jgi:hypothetical protein